MFYVFLPWSTARFLSSGSVYPRISLNGVVPPLQYVRAIDFMLLDLEI